MAHYNQDLVIDFLLSLSFESLTHNIYGCGAMVSNEFGCTKNTAAKWVDRAINTKLIERKDLGFSLIDQDELKEKKAFQAAMNGAVSSGKVTRLASFKAKKVYQIDMDEYYGKA